MCQEFPKEKWLDVQKENVLDAPYYHVVFTVPEELNPISYSNQKHLYDALYHAAAATLNELSKDSRYLGADIGYICILNTGGAAMNYHPHIHTIVLGGVWMLRINGNIPVVNFFFRMELYLGYSVANIWKS